MYGQNSVSIGQTKNMVFYVAHTTATFRESRMHDVAEFEELIASFGQLFDRRTAVIDNMNVNLLNQQRFVTRFPDNTR